MGCFITCGAQTIENPVFERCDVPAFHINKVEITSDTTFIYCTYHADDVSWANISSKTCLMSYPSKERHKMVSNNGLPIAPEKKDFKNAEICEVVLCFPSIKGSDRFDLIESPGDKAFNIYGVSMSNKFEKMFNESDFVRISNFSSFYEASGDTLKAIQYKKEVIDAYRFFYGSKSRELIYVTASLCDMLDKYGFQQEAINQMIKIVKEQDEFWIANKSEYGLFKRKLAEYYSHAKQYNQSIDTYKEALKIYEEINSFDDQYAGTLGLLSDDYAACGDEEKSILYRSKSVDVQKRLGDSERYLEDLVALIIGLDKNSNLLERVRIAEEELASLPEFVDTTSFTYVMNLEAIYKNYSRLGDYTSAIKYCDKILLLLEKYGEEKKYKIAEVLGMKSTFLFFLGNWYESIIWGEESKNIYNSLQIQSTSYIEMLTYLARSYTNVYDYDKAISISQHISFICEEMKDWISLSNSLHDIGCYYKFKEDLISAEIYFRKALDIINSHDKADDYLEKTINGVYIPHRYITEGILKNIQDRIISEKTSILGSLARLQQKMGKIKEAIQQEIEILKIDKENHREESYAIDLMTLSDYYDENNQSKEAILCAEESIELAKKYGNINYSPTILGLAIVYYKEKDIEKAILYAKEAISVSKIFKDFKAMINGYLHLFIFYYTNKDYDKGESVLSEALESLQKSVGRDIYEMKTDQKQRFWSHYEKMFLAYRKLINRINGDGSYNSKLFNYSIFFKSLLLDSECTNVEEFRKRININWENVQNNLSTKDIAIEFVSNKKDSVNIIYYALVIDKTCQYPHIITLFNQSDYVNKKRLSTKTDLDILGDLIWKPILNRYDKIDNIYFSPDGILHKYPIEYCYVDGLGEMMEHYNMYRLSSTKEILFQSKKVSNNKAILYGGLDYDVLANKSNSDKDGDRYGLLRSINARGGFEPLLNTLEEVKEIESLLEGKKVPVSLYTGTEGTEESFRDLSGKDVNMLHLSTHGMYVGPNIVEQTRKEKNFDFLELVTNENDPVKEDIVLTHSFLVMSGGNKLAHREAIGSSMNDGILTAFEISHIDLSKTDIVVLSACETGLGDVENGGVYGLQRGFKKAGANSILMSLDNVDDEATKILMVEFYKNLMNGKTKHQSLKDAQNYLRQVENGKYDKPEYWASFILLDGLN